MPRLLKKKLELRAYLFRIFVCSVCRQRTNIAKRIGATRMKNKIKIESSNCLCLRVFLPSKHLSSFNQFGGLAIQTNYRAYFSVI